MATESEVAMRLTCPSCGAEYEVSDGMVPAAGRHVQCTACHTRWFVRGPGGGLARALSEDQIVERLETLTTRARPRPVAVPDPEPRPATPPPPAAPAKPAERPSVPRPAPVAEAPPPLARPARLEIAAEPSPSPPPAPGPRPRSLFLQGLLVALAIGGLALAAYVWRAPIAEEVPAAAPALDRYAGLVDALRARIEELSDRAPSEQVE